MAFFALVMSFLMGISRTLEGTVNSIPCSSNAAMLPAFSNPRSITMRPSIPSDLIHSTASFRVEVSAMDPGSIWKAIGIPSPSVTRRISVCFRSSPSRLYPHSAYPPISEYVELDVMSMAQVPSGSIFDVRREKNRSIADSLCPRSFVISESTGADRFPRSLSLSFNPFSSTVK